MSKFDPKTLPDYAARLEAAELYATYAKASQAENDAPSGMPDADFSKLEDAREKAEAAYDEHSVELMIDYEGEGSRVTMCAVSGVPLVEGDEVELVLRAAVGLPPRSTSENADLPAAQETA